MPGRARNSQANGRCDCLCWDGKGVGQEMQGSKKVADGVSQSEEHQWKQSAGNEHLHVKTGSGRHRNE